MKKLMLILMIILPIQAMAANKWYYGKVTQIQTSTSDGSFMVYVENNDIAEICAYSRVYFLVSNMGAERTRLAFSLALAAYSSDKRWGVVIDMPETAGSTCLASATASQGAGIRD